MELKEIKLLQQTTEMITTFETCINNLNGIVNAINKFHENNLWLNEKDKDILVNKIMNKILDGCEIEEND